MDYIYIYIYQISVLRVLRATIKLVVTLCPEKQLLGLQAVSNREHCITSYEMDHLGYEAILKKTIHAKLVSANHALVHFCGCTYVPKILINK